MMADSLPASNMPTPISPTSKPTHYSTTDDAIHDMQRNLPPLLSELADANWLSRGQLHVALQLCSEGSKTLLIAYLRYVSDYNISSLLESTLRRVLFRTSAVDQHLAYTDPQTYNVIGHHIDYMYANHLIDDLEYHYLSAQLLKSDVVLEAAVAQLVETANVDELYDTLKRIGKQWQRQADRQDNTYAALYQPAAAYIQWLYKRTLDNKLSVAADYSMLSETNSYMSSSDCMYLLDLLQWNYSNSASHVLFAAVAEYMELDLQATQQPMTDEGSALLEKAQNELDDILLRLSNRWRIECDNPQSVALTVLEELHAEGHLLQCECEVLEEMIYQHNSQLLDACQQYEENESVDDLQVLLNKLFQLLDVAQTVDYESAMDLSVTHLQQIAAVNNRQISLAGFEYLTTLVHTYDPRLIAIGSMIEMNTSTPKAVSEEASDLLFRLSNSWRVKASPEEQRFLVLLNNLVASHHFPDDSFAETLELRIYLHDQQLLSAFTSFRQRYDELQGEDERSKVWDQFWVEGLCQTLAQHHEGLDQL